jgi:hypothetical protein
MCPAEPRTTRNQTASALSELMAGVDPLPWSDCRRRFDDRLQRQRPPVISSWRLFRRFFPA